MEAIYDKIHPIFVLVIFFIAVALVCHLIKKDEINK